MPIRKDLLHFYRTPGWYAAREAVKLRAKDCCESCGAKNGSSYARETKKEARFEIMPQDLEAAMLVGYSVVKIQCGCAHVNGIAGDDRIDENLRWWCRGCHLHHDAPFHKQTRATRKDEKRPLIAQCLGSPVSTDSSSPLREGDS